jgi:ankyrin repeat protein
MDLLCRCNDGTLLQRSLFHLPESLNDAYGESMTRIVSQNPFASRCLYWTLYAQRPLTVGELKFAASFELQGKANTKESPSSAQTMLHEAAGLLTIDAMNGTVHLVHKTAKEYLSGPAARVFFPTAKVNIADVCLTVITPDEVIDGCYVNQGATPRKPRGELLDYATAYWGYHAREIGDDEQATQVLIRAFLNKLCWRRPPGIDSCAPGIEIPKQLGFGKYFSDWTSLHVLAYFGIIGKAKRMIEQGVDINDCDNQLGITPLHCAVYQGNEEMVELLLASKANVNATCKDGRTVLHMAGQQGHRKLIKLLLHRRVNSRTANQQGATALQLAVGTTHDEATVPLLIKSRFDMDVQNTVTGNTALHLAVELKRPRILAFLLEKGASMNILNRDGLTALQLACKTDNCEAVSLLLERGAQLETRSSHGTTALHLSASMGNWVAFDLLVIGGADINAWDSDGNSLLHKQAQGLLSTSIATHLIKQGANIEACNSQGYTPLQCAAVSGNKAMFLSLLDHGSRIDVQTAKGETLLHIIPPLNQNCLEILRTLLKLNFSANAKTCNGSTPLHNLVINAANSPDTLSEHTAAFISLFLSHGANINAPVASYMAETALHLAVTAKFPSESLISLLIENGASLDAKTSEGKTPLHLAAERGRHNIFQLLLDAGADPSIKDFEKTPTNDKLRGDGLTAIDLARKNPVSVLWFDTAGELQSPIRSMQQRRSLATTIDSNGIESEIDEIGGSTLVDEDNSIWGSRASTTSMDLPSIVSSSC